MEEDIDIETLQAQIDLSLAYTQNLVSSWVKPPNKPTKNTTRALIEAEIKDNMRRPPRLGVGAAVPETVASSSRDTERLKARLTGKGNNKRAREEDNEPGSSKQQKQQLSDAEEDSRGASHKKKARLDPFEARNKKKKDKEVVSKPSTPPLQTPKNVDKASVIETDVQPEGDGLRTTISDSASPLVSPSKRRKKKHKNKIPLTESASQAGQSKDALMDIDASVDAPTTSNLGNDKDSPPPTPEPIDISLITESTPASPVSPTRERKHSPLLKGPLLNLTGPPPSGSESDGEDDREQNATSPSKKKRRKRKKKKNSMGGAKLGVQV